jgi:hypothetical protein
MCKGCGKDKFGNKVDVEKQIQKAQERKNKRLKELRDKLKAKKAK